ncbi:MAG: ribonuclease HII [Pseudomonadota bacterium]
MTERLNFAVEEGFGAGKGRIIAGVDEVGRGPLAGPVTAAAVILPPAAVTAGRFADVADSKKLTEKDRNSLCRLICREATVRIGWATVAEIDQLNILQASLLAMRRALARLPQRPDLALIDGKQLPPDLPIQAEAIVGGDANVLSIAAASIVAKVERDGLMAVLDRRYPGYGWATNKGYPTPAHRAALIDLGVTPEHRRSFAPVRAVAGSPGSA